MLSAPQQQLLIPLQQLPRKASQIFIKKRKEGEMKMYGIYVYRNTELLKKGICFSASLRKLTAFLLLLVWAVNKINAVFHLFLQRCDCK